MSNCSSCNCNPCTCSCSCDPQNEALSSAFQNFIDGFIGSITKQCVNGSVVWTWPCNLEDEFTGFPKSPGETILCYQRRAIEELFAAGGGGGALLAINNLSDVDNAAAALLNIGGQPLCDDLTQICNVGWQNGDIMYRDGTAILTRLPAGSNTEVLTMSGGFPSWQPAAGGGGNLGYTLLRDIKTSGIDGGTFTVGAWQVRTLNEIALDADSNVTSLIANVFTLVPGVYEYFISAPAHQVNRHAVRLYDILAAIEILRGSSEIDPVGAAGSSTRSFVNGKFTAAIGNSYRVEHQCIVTAITFGFGVSTGIVGSNEVYTTVELRRIS